MVGVVGSNPIVSTKFHQPLSIRDAEECRELALRQEFFPAEADSFVVARLRVTVERERQLRLPFSLFIFFVVIPAKVGTHQLSNALVRMQLQLDRVGSRFRGDDAEFVER